MGGAPAPGVVIVVRAVAAIVLVLALLAVGLLAGDRIFLRPRLAVAAGVGARVVVAQDAVHARRIAVGVGAHLARRAVGASTEAGHAVVVAMRVVGLRTAHPSATEPLQSDVSRLLGNPEGTAVHGFQLELYILI